MPVAPELNFQDFSTVLGPLQPKPQSIVSANVVVPVSFYTILTGNTVIKTITPPFPNATHMLAFLFAGIAGVDATGNIATAKATVAGEVLLLVWNPNTQKYSPVG